MNRDDVEWWGYWTAAPTPFAEDETLDEAALRDLLSLYVEHEIQGVLVNGTTGEWYTQTRAERRAVVEIAVDQVNGRIPVLVGVSAFTAAQAIELAADAADVGADGVLATPPPYVHPDEAEILAFFRRVSEATELPFVVYNWPRGVGVDIAANEELVRSLADLDRVVAFKESTGDWLRAVQTVEAIGAQLRVFGPFISRRGLAILRGLGGDGSIDGGCLGAPFAVQFYRAVRLGDDEKAAKWAKSYTEVSSRLIKGDYSGVFASPVAQLKAAMAMLGQPGGHVRDPLLPVTSPDVLSSLAEVIKECGLLEAWQGMPA